MLEVKVLMLNGPKLNKFPRNDGDGSSGRQRATMAVASHEANAKARTERFKRPLFILNLSRI